MLWGPIPGYYFFVSIFIDLNYKFFRKKYKNENWSRTLFLFQHDRMFWINDYADLRLAGQSVFFKYMLPRTKRKGIYKLWKRNIVELLALEKKISKLDLAKQTDKQLLKLWQNFHKKYLDFWTQGLVPELANYGADKLLEAELGKKIFENSQIMSLLEILTAPEKLSFYQEEELVLSKARDLKKHQKKYFWLKNSYAGVQILPEEFFKQRQKELSSGIEQELQKKIAEAKNKKLIAKRNHQLTREIMNLAEAIASGIAWQDERKKCIFMALHFQNLLLDEVARRFGYEKNDLLNCWYWEIVEIMKGKNLHLQLKKRREGMGVDFFKDYKMLSAKQTAGYWQMYSGKIEGDSSVKELSGLVVSKGKGGIVRGKTKILLDPLAVNAFEPGEILVAPMTSPEYIFAMRRAKAVITDTGGLTSHAAIVSRELGIPCIVNTKVATRVLQDGDEVEVDIYLGKIRKI